MILSKIKGEMFQSISKTIARLWAGVTAGACHSVFLNTAILTGLFFSFCSKDACADTSPPLVPVEWTLGSNVMLSGTLGGLIKSGGGSTTWNGDSTSLNQFIAYSGRVVFKADLGSHLGVGLSLMNENSGYTDLDFAILVRADNTARIYEGGTAGPVIGEYTSSTLFEIRRAKEKIEYVKDSVVVHTSSLPAAGKLYIETSFYKLGSILSESYIYDGDLDGDEMPDSWESSHLPPDHGWNDIVSFSAVGDADADGVTNLQEFADSTDPLSPIDLLDHVVWLDFQGSASTGSNGGLVKTGGAAGWNADARSSQVIVGNGQLNFKANAGSNLIVGLTSSNDSRSNADLEYGIQLATSNTATAKRPESTTNIALGDYTADTVFSIQRKAGQVHYMKDGVIIYTSTTPNSEPLIADCSLNALGAMITEARIKTDDLDEDGMPDSWEARYLIANPTVTGLEAFLPNQDDDGDGILNHDEYFEGTNPKMALAYQAGVTWVPSSTNNVLVGLDGLAKKIAGGTAWTNADAVATKIVEHSGCVSFSVASPSYLGVGFTDSNDNRSYSDLEYCIRVTSGNVAHVYEGTTQKAALGSYDENTRFAIRRIGGLVEYLKDGVVYYTSAVPVSGSLLLDCSFYTNNSEVSVARLYTGDLDEDSITDEWEYEHLQKMFPGQTITLATLNQEFLPGNDEDGDGITNLDEFRYGTNPLQQTSKPYPVTWTSLANTTASGTNGDLKKTSGTAAYNADAASVESLAADGIFSFSATGTGTMAVGLTYQNDSRAVADLEYGFTFASSSAQIKRPETTSNLAIGSYTASTVFGIRRVGSVIEFLKDGVVLHTSTTPSAGALYADCAIYTLNNEITSSYFYTGDVDNDGLPDEWEFQALPPNVDLAQLAALLPTDDGPDNDGVSLMQEFQSGTSPLLADSDGDGMVDAWEILYGLAANNATNTSTDADNDGLTNYEEYQVGTNPSEADSDGDGMPDGFEVTYGLLPSDKEDSDTDYDGDRVPNLWEYIRGTSVNNSESTPEWDAVVDPKIAYDEPEEKKFRTLASAYNSLPSNDASAAYLILVMPGTQSSTSFSTVSSPSRRVAIVSAGSPDRISWSEGPVVKSPWQLSGEILVDGLIFEGDSATITVASVNGQPAANVRFVNSLFRDISPERFLGSYQNYGALTLVSGSLSLSHCTLYGCNTHRSGQPVASIAELGVGNATLKNSVIWDDSYPSSTPVTGDGVLIQSSLIQGGMSGAINSDPHLMSKGYPTSISEACFLAAQPSSLKWDLHGQLRSNINPTLGAVEWVNPDGDGLPDWWEEWWFDHTNTVDGDLTNPYDYYWEAGFSKPRLRTALEYYLAFLKPTVSFDGDNLIDSWEIIHFGNLTQTDTGNPDGDARNNLEEQEAGTDPMQKDWDYDSEPDGLQDGWERVHFGSEVIYDGDDDADFDGWTNIQEQANGTDPNAADIPPDSDSDGLPDSWEIEFFSAMVPLPYTDREINEGETALEYALRFTGADDCDQDGISNLHEYLAGTSPLEKPYLYDGNSNGLWDWWENRFFNGLLPSASAATDDPDNDGRSNEREMLEGSNPLVAETLPVLGAIHDYSFSTTIPDYEYNDWTGFEERYVIAAKSKDEIDNTYRYHRWTLNDGHEDTEMLDLSLPAWEQFPDFLVDGEGVEARYVSNGPEKENETYLRTQGRFRIWPGMGPAKRLIVKTYRKYQERLKSGGLATNHHFVIPRGHYHSNGLPVTLEAPKDGEFVYRDDDDQGTGHFYSYDWLEESAVNIPRRLPPNDVAGPRYRKIGLNGVPTPDGLPGDQNMEGALPEETYIDAYTRQLRHSTSDVWSSSPSTDLPIQVRRDLAPESWSWSSGLRPDERPDRPFGPCWTSNLTPHIKLELNENHD